MNTLGHVKACHSPHNERCAHNADPAFDCQCRCAEPRQRKPYRVLRVSLRPEFVEGRHRAAMVLEVHPDGLLRIRESGRRRVYETNVGRIYHGCVWREAMLGAQAKAKAKAAKKKTRTRRR